MKLNDFRVEEYDSVFQIQRKKVKIKTTGILWWKKTEEKTQWKYIDKFGNYLYSVTINSICHSNYHSKCESFYDLGKAFDKIHTIIKGKKYHY